MDISRATVGVIAAVCVTVGATGTYLVTAGRTSPGQAREQVVDDGLGSARPLPAQSPDRRELSDRRNLTTSAAPPPRLRPASAKAPARSGGLRPAPAVRRSAPVSDRQTSASDRRTSVSDRSTTVSDRPTPASDRSTTVSDRRGGPSGPPNVPAPVTASLDARALPRPEPPAPARPPLPRYIDLVIPADAVMGLQMDSSVTSETARVEDPVSARVTRDVRVDDRVAIPAGSSAHGEVVLVERGGRLRDRARLGVRFHTVVLPDGTHVPLETEAVYREGDAPSNNSAAKIGGGAIGGAILGGIFGGAKGAIIGGSAGAGVGTAAVLGGGRDAAILPSGSPLTIRLQQPATVTIEN